MCIHEAAHVSERTPVLKCAFACECECRGERVGRCKNVRASGGSMCGSSMDPAATRTCRGWGGGGRLGGDRGVSSVHCITRICALVRMRR